jgi:SAM-dependent methyltransferase
MTDVIPFRKRRFRHAARHYLSGRPAYAAALIRRLAGLAGLGPRSRVLDLGCGPGQLAIALTPFAGEVVGIDPEPDMLRIAREAAAAAGLAIHLVEGSSADLGPALGRFDLAVIGRAFHWMDRPRTLALLDGLILPGGAVALLHTRTPKLPDNAWAETFDSLIDRYSAGDEARRRRKSPGWIPHEAFLLDSPFCRIEKIAVVERRRTDLEGLIDRALSLSSTSAGGTEDRSAEIAREMRAALTPFADGGAILEVVESEAIIAWRPEA